MSLGEVMVSREDTWMASIVRRTNLTTTGF
jgi:hypothetical protein